MAKRINEREALFIAYYQSPGETFQNASKSALKAGYSPKSSPTIGSQLLRKPKIKEAIQKHLNAKREAITKEDYIDTAMNDYKALELTEANKPRFLDIAGKALGYIGVNAENQRPNQTLNINLLHGQDKDTLLANVRRLLSHQDSQP
jgi:hypothetical protein